MTSGVARKLTNTKRVARAWDKRIINVQEYQIEAVYWNAERDRSRGVTYFMYAFYSPVSQCDKTMTALALVINEEKAIACQVVAFTAAVQGRALNNDF